MKPNKRQKLCYNCEGDVDVDVIVCPFCAADLRDVKPDQQFKKTFSTTPSVDAHYSESYSTVKTAVETMEEAAASTDVSAGSASLWYLVSSISVFSIGVFAFILGIVLLIFSREGVLLLKWDARLWFVYLFASVPFLVFGYRALHRN